jgi:hypothetical protein
MRSLIRRVNAIPLLIPLLAWKAPHIMAQDATLPPPVTSDRPRAQNGRDLARARRIALFRARDFPTVDAPAIDAATLDTALEGLSVEVLSSPEALDDRLGTGGFDVLVLPYGSAFPLRAWGSIRSFLAKGGGLVVLGGAPFHVPVRWVASGEGRNGAAGAWVAGPRQPTFAHELLIGPAEEIALDTAGSLRVTEFLDAPAPAGGFPTPSRTFALTVRFATRKEFPDEDGSAGPRDALLRPLVHALDAGGTPRGCPLLEIDRLRGSDAGGRWVLAPSDVRLTPAWIRACVERALEGAVEIDVRPVPACVEAGEKPRIRILLRRPSAMEGDPARVVARVVVRDDRGAEVFAGEAELTGSPETRAAEVAVRTPAPLRPGLHRVEVTALETPWHPRSATTGFWVRDPKLLAAGPKLSVSRDWLRRDGRVFPLVGTTYMASDVHRKFLFEPNPLAWDRDFAEMARRGVNFVRTGLWTGWSRAMLDPGAIDDGVLWALDAYVLTAARHGIPVCFTFVAFLPPVFGGSHPYLDPRALEGQKAFLLAIASRFRSIGWIHYDLINEPSYAPPEALWQNRPILDEHERRAWSDWARARHGDDPLVLRERWRDASDDLFSLPTAEELSYAMVRDRRRPRKARDFAEFSQDVVARWAATLRQTLRDAAGEQTLVTLGQDEGGTWLRPAQQLHAEAVDYTAVHTWWNNDDLLWDGVVTKVPEKPNVVQETGLMRLEDPDGMPWRSPEDAAALLERKFAFAFAARAAGAVEWAWNVNPYQPIDNEAVIGLWRPDGTAKPELRVLEEVAAFFREAAPLLDDFEPDPVVVVIPHSKLFAGRPQAMDGVKRVVRVLADRFGVVPTALSELRLTPARLGAAKLVLVPSPEVLDDGAARALVHAARAGAKILVTGAVEGDPYGRSTEALRDLGVLHRGRPVALREPTSWAAGAQRTAGFATFDGGRGEWLCRASGTSLTQLAGSVWHEPLPLDLAREEEPLCALLAAALEKAAIPVSPSATPLAARVLRSPRAALVVCVNETAADAVRHVEVDAQGLEVAVASGRARLVLVERQTRRVIAATPGASMAPGR